MGRRLQVLIAVCLIAAPVIAQDPYYLVTNVPQTLRGGPAQPSDALLNNGGTYRLELSLPPRTRIGALDRKGSGEWLISVRTQWVLGGTTVEPRDIVEFDGASFTTVFDGSAEGVPARSKIDAFVVMAGGDWIFSFDVPTTLGAMHYERADLVRFDPVAHVFDPVPYFDASSATPPIPPSRNVVGADLLPGVTLLALDTPTQLGAIDYEPGQILSWDGVGFAIVEDPAGWPTDRSRHLAAFDLLPDIGPGEVTELRLGKSAGGSLLVLSWEQSCSIAAFEYGISEGQLGTWYSHSQISCSDPAPYRTQTVPTPIDNRYYIVVPLSNGAEGSYGKRKDGPVLSERQVGSPSTCFASQSLGCP